MADQGLSFSREHEMPIYYKDQQVGTRRADFLVANVVMVELKAIIQLEDVHLAQAINYLEAYDIEVGLLITTSAPEASSSNASPTGRCLNCDSCDSVIGMIGST